MANNKNLHKASKEKNDEFYTQLTDIEKELKHYKDHFKDKVVFCNCDDPKWSNFYQFFFLNFEAFRLKKLIATHFDKEKPTYKLVIDRENYMEVKNNEKKPDKIPLKQNGDFRSDECIELLKESDIVVTNPPFSLFREYIAQIVKYDKKFLILGNNNALTYKETFKLVKDNKLWMGYSVNKTMEFQLANDYSKWDKIDEKGKKYGKVPAISWFTNLSHKKRTEDLILCKKYSGNEKDYINYANYDAINIDKVSEIPMDYDGYMGVPITFLDKYNPEQFEIIGLGIANLGLEIGISPYKAEHKIYRKETQKKGAVDGDLYMIINGIVTVPYARIIIKNKKISGETK